MKGPQEYTGFHYSHLGLPTWIWKQKEQVQTNMGDGHTEEFQYITTLILLLCTIHIIRSHPCDL